MTHDVIVQETITFVSMIALAAFSFWLLFRRRQTILHIEYYRLEVLNKMIDKYGSGPEFISFMQTEAGKRLLESPRKSNANTQATQSTMVLRFIQVGVMLLVIGAGFMAQSDMYGPDTAYWGIMCFMLTIGLWLVAAITAIWNRMQRRAAGRAMTAEVAQS